MGIRLNLGCGPHDIRSDYMNVDIISYKGVDYIADVRNLAEVVDGQAEFILAQHILEYIPRRDMVRALEEWRRVLAPSGHLEIRVPDIAAVAKGAFHNSISGEMGIPTEMVISLLYGAGTDEHSVIKSGFTGSFLQGILVGLGLRTVSLVYEGYDVILSAMKVA